MSSPGSARTRLIRWGLVVVLVAGGIWVLFLDTHSVMHRMELHREYQRLQSENAQLRISIDTLREELADSLSDAEVERIAREKYGMQYPDETVHRVE